jgi:hypothetical protein
MTDDTELNTELLKVEFLNTAEWRRQKAAEYPDDKRNLEAADLLERLAETVDQVEPALLQAYVELWEDAPEAEALSDMLREIGFYTAPKTATEFVAAFISRMTSGA